MNIADYKRILAPLQSNTLQLRMTFLKQVRHKLRAVECGSNSIPPSVHCCAVTHAGSTADALSELVKLFLPMHSKQSDLPNKARAV